MQKRKEKKIQSRTGYGLTLVLPTHVQFTSWNQGKIFRPENPDFGKNFRFRYYPETIFRRNFEFFGFKNSKKFKKNENWIFRPDSLLSGRISVLFGRKTLF